MSAPKLPVVFLSGAFLLIALVLASFPLSPAPTPPPGVPTISKESRALGAGACRMCHPSEHDSWHQSYHRSMTRQVAELGFDGASSPKLPQDLELDGVRFTITRERTVIGPDLHEAGERLFALKSSADGAAAKDVLGSVSTRERKLALVTGSHHYLAFWVEGGDSRELRQLPFVYLLTEKSWAPRREVFLQPPDAPPHISRWNANCISCHAVGGKPRESEGVDEAGFWVRYQTEVSELGITCQACHGQGEEHQKRMQNPIKRFVSATGAETREPTSASVVHPKKLSAEESSAICGQCHSYFVPRDAERFWETGLSGTFTVGQGQKDLEKDRLLLTPSPEALKAGGVSRDVASIFWADGSIRVGGREYTALLQSDCYSRGQGEGQLGCLSCHSMHAGAPNDQLRPELEDNPDASCQNCHASTPEHSGHPEGSIGKSCVSCHMPKTTYALLKGIRSHTIQSPTLTLDEPPSACALCHVDRTAAWLTKELSNLRKSVRKSNTGDAGQAAANHSATSNAASTSLDADTSALPFATLEALSGNAASRALFAYAFGQPEARLTAPAYSTSPILRQLTSDPYAAVRRIAARSLKQIESAPHPTDSALQATEPTQDDLEVLRSLHRRRDQTPIVISE